MEEKKTQEIKHKKKIRERKGINKWRFQNYKCGGTRIEFDLKEVWKQEQDKICL
jgi:hypothetical protein